MKRSEMIEIMIKADQNQSACRSLYHTFDHILKAMEDAGMLPPEWMHVEGEHSWEQE